MLAATDARGKRIRLPEPPRRIVSLVPSQTELLASLGLEEEVVGLTRFCERPPDWREAKTIVGGTKQINVETVREVEPDFILANYEENTREDVEALATIAPIYVTNVTDVPEALDMIRTVGHLTDTTDKARSLAEKVAHRFELLPQFPPLRTVFLIWRTPFLTVGGDTFVHDVMGRGGFVNVFAERTRYPEVSLQEIADQDPDLLLCATEPFPFHKKEKFTADLRSALPNTPLEIVDGQVYMWYGSRLLETPAALRSHRKQLETPSASSSP